MFYFGMPTVQNNYLGLKYINNDREIDFFYGHKKNIKTNKYFITYSIPLKTGISLGFSAGTGEVNIAERKSSENDLTAVTVGMEKDIGGDLVVFPQWKVNLTLEGGYTTISEYEQREIDISYKYLKTDFAVAVAKKYGFLVPFGGINFYYSRDIFEENETNEKEAGETNGISPFLGIRLNVTDNTLIRGRANFYDQQGFEASFNLVF
ncbi:MAG: hypothetical protein ACQEQC_00640 [Elusimicrobiota bacterium]